MGDPFMTRLRTVYLYAAGLPGAPISFRAASEI